MSVTHKARKQASEAFDLQRQLIEVRGVLGALRLLVTLLQGLGKAGIVCAVALSEGERGTRVFSIWHLRNKKLGLTSGAQALHIPTDSKENETSCLQDSQVQLILIRDLRNLADITPAP